MNNFETIYKENYLKIYSLAVKLISDKDIAKDITQETFIALYSSYSKNIEIKYPKTWLYKVATNKCFDIIKQRKLFNTINLDDTHIIDNNDDSNNKSEYIQYALKQLSAQNRLLVILYSEGISYKGMAEHTGIKFSSIGKTLSRALKKLEIELKDKKDELY